MGTLSKKAEEQTIAAIKRAVSLVDDAKLTPDAAIEKVARDEGWGQDMIRFASFAYNTGRQTAQREDATSVLDKLASFPIVDPDKVIAAIWPSAVKSAVEQQQLTGISAEYSLPPTWHGDREKAAAFAVMRQPMQKAASVATLPVEKQPITKALNKQAAMRKTAEVARREASQAYDRMLGSLDQLGTYFRKSAYDRQVAFADAELAAVTYYGHAGRSLMNWVYDGMPVKEARMSAVKTASLIEADRNVAPYNLIQSCIDHAKNVGIKRAAEAATRTALDVFEQETLNSFRQAPVTTKAAGASYPEPYVEASLIKSAVGFLAGAAGGLGTKELIQTAIGNFGNTDKDVEKATFELEDPRHDADLRRIRTQTMFSDLMNDDIIGSYDPEVVAKAYNEISQFAPRSSLQPLVMRASLRRHLQGNVEQFENKELADIEKGMKEIEGPASITYPTSQAKSQDNATPKV